jgi:hypothetical protein
MADSTTHYPKLYLPSMDQEMERIDRQMIIENPRYLGHGQWLPERPVSHFPDANTMLIGCILFLFLFKSIIDLIMLSKNKPRENK